MNTRESITVGLLWHSVNSNNLGIGALTVSNIAIVESAASDLNIEVKFVILGWQDPESQYVLAENISAPRLRARHLLRPDGFFRYARKCDFVIDISTGDGFADIYGVRRIALNLFGKTAVLLAGKPLVFGPQTIGPFQRYWAQIAAKFMMARAELVATRDHLSTNYVSNLLTSENVIEATDVAMRLPYIVDRYPKTENTVRFGLNVSGLMFNGGYNRNNMFGLAVDYPRLVRSIIAYMQSQKNCEVHLIAHVISPTMVIEDDYRVCKQLSEEFSGTVFAPQFAHPSDAKSYISTMDFFCGARMHACIAAFSSGVPTVPMAYSRKFEGLFGTLDYPWMTDLRSQSSEEILATIKNGFVERKKMRLDVAECFGKAEAKLAVYEKHIKGFLERAASHP